MTEQEKTDKSKVLYLVLVLCYFFSAHLLSSISFQSQVVPIWLPAGFALVGCYLFWLRFLPAVFFASFAFNCTVNPQFELVQILSTMGIQNALIALGSTMQALIGSALLRFWLGSPMQQKSNGKNFLFCRDGWLIG